MTGFVPIAVNPDTVPVVQSVSADDTGVDCTPVFVGLQTGGVGIVVTTITAGSVLSTALFGLVGFSAGLLTVAVLVIVPDVATTRTGTTISGNETQLPRVSERVHVIDRDATVASQDHPDAAILPFGFTPTGSVSTTVVVPDTFAGPLLVTRII